MEAAETRSADPSLVEMRGPNLLSALSATNLVVRSGQGRSDKEDSLGTY